MADSRFYKLPRELAARRDLPPGAKIILSVLRDRMGNNGFCWPGVRTLANDSGLTVTGVLGCLRALESRGDLQIERRGSGRANHYRLPASESAQESGALNKVKRSTKLNSGAQQSVAQALNKVEHNQRDQLNQTKSKRTFSPPTAKEVEEYAGSIDFQLDGEKFVSHYAANGWMRGRTKMRDWRAAVRYWKATEKKQDGTSEDRNSTGRPGEFIR